MLLFSQIAAQTFSVWVSLDYGFVGAAEFIILLVYCIFCLVFLLTYLVRPDYYFRKLFESFLHH